MGASKRNFKVEGRFLKEKIYTKHTFSIVQAKST